MANDDVVTDLLALLEERMTCRACRRFTNWSESIASCGSKCN